MPKDLVIESRFDFRGGRNTFLSPDLLSENELVDSTNARVDIDGPVTKRTGSRRLHASALNAATTIKGIIQWDGPSGKQIVAICNGDLFYRNAASGEFAAFTNIDPGVTDAFSTTELSTFATLRASDSGAPLKLYIASGGKLYEWSGTVLSRLDGSSSALGQFAPDAQLVDSYHVRLFTNSVVRPQHLVWSRLGDGRVYKAGLASDGGTAMVSAIQNETITALLTLGRSLLIATPNSIARLAGYSAADIAIDQDTEGLSPDVGIVGRLAWHRVEHTAFLVSDRGPYLASESTVAPIGLKVQPDFDRIDRTKLSDIVVGHHHGRSEVYIALPGLSDSGLNKTVIIFNTRHQAFYGPFLYPFGITSFSHYEDPNGDEFIIAGCSDGFIRHLDTGKKDDVLSDATGGSNISYTVELAPIFFTHPGTTHALRSAFIQCEIPASATSFIGIKFDEQGSFTDFAIPSTTSILKNVRVDLSKQGRRLRIRFTDASGEIPAIHGIIIQASNLLRQPS